MTNTVFYPSLGGTWLNKDGLTVRFGAAGAVDQIVGKPTNYGDDQEIIVTVRSDLLFSTNQSANTFGQVEAGVPTTPFVAGTVLKSAFWTVTTAFTSATSAARLNVGLVMQTGQPGTGGSNTGIMSARNVIGDTTYVENTLSSQGLLNTKLANDTGGGPEGLYIWLSTTGSEPFTAGEGRLRIIYFTPHPDDPSGLNSEL